jgi:replication factor C subunit 3/5
MESENNLPWIEKYRAKYLTDIINHDDSILALKNAIDNKSLMNLILYGPPGTGKTSLIHAIARYLYPSETNENEYKKYTIEINASSDRGIETIRTTIKDYVKLYSPVNIKLVILDEIDAMTQDAQSALRGIIDDYSVHNRFCLICNNIEKIIPALKSRCLPIKFFTPPMKVVKMKLESIILAEKINITDEALTILSNQKTDLRTLIGYLQGIHFLYSIGSDNIITAENMLKYLRIPTDEEIESLYCILIEGNFKKSYDTLIDLFKSGKWELNKLISFLFNRVLSAPEFDDSVKKYNIIKDLSKIEHRIKNNGDSEIQLAYLAATWGRT